MHAIARHSLLSGRSALQSCRFIAGRRFAVAPNRTFRSTVRCLDSNETGPRGGLDTRTDSSANSAISSPSSETPSQVTPAEQEDATQTSDQPPEPPDGNDVPTYMTLEEAVAGKSGKGPYGSGRRRMRRNTSQRLESVVTAPPQYVQNNIKLYQPATEGDPIHNEIQGGNASGRPDEEIYPNATVGSGAYQVYREVLFEVQASVNAGLRPPWAGEADSLPASKPHLVLQSPKEGGSAFLDAVVENVAQRCRADVVTLDAQDIAEFVTEHNIMNTPPYTTGSLRTLGYDTHVVPPGEESKETESDGEPDGYDEIELDATPTKTGMGKAKGSYFTAQPVMISTMSTNLNDILKPFMKQSSSIGKPEEQQAASEGQPGTYGVPPDNAVVAKFIESLLNETESQRQARAHRSDTEETSAIETDKPDGEASTTTVPPPVASANRGTILHIKDYLEIYSTAAGSGLLRSIHNLVLNRRKGGKNLLLLGTSSSEDLLPSYTNDGWKDIQNESTSGPFRILIVPCASPEADDIFRSDEGNRTREINIRHFQDMIRRTTFSPERTDSICRRGKLELASSSVFTAGLSEEVWSFEHVQRLANTALGLLRHDEEMTAEHIEWAMNMISGSDAAKAEWLAKDRKQPATPKTNSAEEAKEIQEERMKKLKKQCNQHEKKLLNGVVDPANISTTFDNVRAAGATKDALRDLTTLSLTRPEAFTYGILAQEKIPGLLLYGPPGTGKTLLAKAVAKESGATVLEVSGSDVYDMYVGEGEKNVRAIFSLAKKIAPCVVFIDEADAIFGHRSNGGSRTTHREIINQFLREWDGMNEKSAFIMVATNRPFDLDDAVLRRLPRRLLVDLPTEKDREEILKIHLRDEKLADDVDIAKLAQKTPFYSGSDLKNVCVAAALTCVREESDAVLKHAREAAATQTALAESESQSETETALTHNETPNAESKSLSTQGEALMTENETTATQQASDKEKTAGQNSNEPHRIPERRVLQDRHFDKALFEISASISDDMSSLTAIRRFDEKYGDRRGRRKRVGGPGFGTVTEKEREKLEDGRVRTGE